VVLGWCIVQIRYYPTLILYNDGNRLSEYNEERDLDSLQEYLLKFIQRHDEL